MVRIIIISLAATLFTFNSGALTTNDNEPGSHIFGKKTYIKFSPPSLLDPYIPSIQGGIEYQIYRFISVYHEYGYIDYFLLPKSGRWVSGLQGHKFINTFKFYTTDNDNKYLKHFFGLEAGLNKYKAFKEIWVDKGPYEMLEPCTYTIKAYYGHLTMGLNIHLKSLYNLCFEITTGFGYRYREVTSDIPPELHRTIFFFSPLTSQLQHHVSMRFGIRIGYLFGKYKQ